MFVAVGLLLSGCGEAVVDETLQDVRVAVDATLQTIVSEELAVFNTRHETAVLMEQYVPETDALNLLLQDSLRLIITTRPLSEEEINAIANAHLLKVRQQVVAYDAVALIQHKSNPDSLITIGEMQKVMVGSVKNWKELGGPDAEIEVVFDNSGSSLVRYVHDSICGGRDFGGIVKEAGTNSAVIDYVAQTPGALGIVGVDWLRNPNDSTRLRFNDNIRVMSVSRSAVADEGNSFQPFQYYIATGQYPWTRGVWAITTDPRQRSMGLNFYYFLSDEAGQLIITRSSQLLPSMPVHVRTVDITS